VKEEDATSEDAVDDGEDEEEAEVLFVLSKRSEAAAKHNLFNIVPKN